MSDMRVLIVDDEEDMRALVRATIEIANEGLTVAAEAPDGETAVDLVRTEHPEVVVLDHRMPGTSGLETARANGYDTQLPLWRAFFDGFVDHA